MKMQLNIKLKYLIINILTIKKRSYLNVRKRYNINLKKTFSTFENAKNVI